MHCLRVQVSRSITKCTRAGALAHVGRHRAFVLSCCVYTRHVFYAFQDLLGLCTILSNKVQQQDRAECEHYADANCNDELPIHFLYASTHVCMRKSVRACVRACVRAWCVLTSDVYVHACMHACACPCSRVRQACQLSDVAAVNKFWFHRRLSLHCHNAKDPHWFWKHLGNTSFARHYT